MTERIRRYNGDQGFFERKLERAAERLSAAAGSPVCGLDWGWGRQDCWVLFYYRGQPYQFRHSMAAALARGYKFTRGLDVFAQLVYGIEDLARLVERGLYDLGVWIEPFKALPAPSDVPDCLRRLGFDRAPRSREEVVAHYHTMARLQHPDNQETGDEQAMVLLNRAKDEALQLVGG